MTTSGERATFVQDLEALPASLRCVGTIVAPIGGMSRPDGTAGVVPPRAKRGRAGDVDVPSNCHVVELLELVDDGRLHLPVYLAEGLKAVTQPFWSVNVDSTNFD